MCQSVNKVILIGFLGETPKVRFNQQGKPVGNRVDCFRVRQAQSQKVVRTSFSSDVRLGMTNLP